MRHLRILPDKDDASAWRISIPPDVTRRNFCSALVLLDEDRELRHREPKLLAEAPFGDFGISHPGQFVVGIVSGTGLSPVTLVSLYGIWDQMTDSGDLYAEATLHRAISDLTIVLQERTANRVIIAGDLNVWHRYPPKTWGGRYATVFDRLAAYGLDLVGPFLKPGLERLGPCPFSDWDCRHEATYRSNKGTWFPNDYVFASKALKPVRCDVGDYVASASDHRPVIAEFEA